MFVYIFISLFNKCMMVPSILPFPVLLKCGVVRSSPPHSGPLLLSYCLRAAGKGGSSIYKIELCSGGYFIFFHTVYYRYGLFLFPVLYICCLVAVSQRLLVPRVLTLNG